MAMTKSGVQVTRQRMKGSQRVEQRRPISFTKPITPFYPASWVHASRQFRSIAE
jgi:hypothetical protein